MTRAWVHFPSLNISLHKQLNIGNVTLHQGQRLVPVGISYPKTPNILHNAVGMPFDRTSPARRSKRLCKWTTTLLSLSFLFHLAGAWSEGLLRRTVVMGTLFAFPSERFQSCCRWTGIQTLHWAQNSLQKQLSICGHSLRDIMGVLLSKVKQKEMEKN